MTTNGSPFTHPAPRTPISLLPADFTGLSFLDVGCWEGHACVQALRRGAERVVGLDLCVSESLRSNVRNWDFEFWQMDIMSEAAYSLGQFDVVLCAGVLYHVYNPAGLLLRLRHLTKKVLILETAANAQPDDLPLWQFHPAATLDDNPTNWWTPNLPGLEALLMKCGFLPVEMERYAPGRAYAQATPTYPLNPARFQPRKLSRMSINGGERGQ